MKQLLFACLLSLLLVTPALALDYTGTASLDWSSLTMSGIAVVPDDSFPGRSQGRGVQVDSPVGPAGMGLPYGLSMGYNSPSWSNGNLTITLPDPYNFGSGSSIVNENQLTALAAIHGAGSISAFIARTTAFQAAETGNLTMSVHYSLTQVGVPPLHSGFDSTVTAVMNLNGATSLATLTSSSGPGQTGILSITRFFQAGDVGAFQSYASAQVTQTVPVPDMLWPALMSMILAGWVVRWRQTR